MSPSDWDQLVWCAANADIAQMAQHFGLDLIRCGRGFRHREFDSLKVNGNLWKRWSGKTGVLGLYTKGSTIQLIQEYTGLSFQKAVLEIAAHAAPDLYAKVTGSADKRISLSERTRMAAKTQRRAAPSLPQEPFRLPTKSRTAEDVFRYLTKERAIDPEIVKRELRAGRLYQDTRRNCVFVGHNDQGMPAFACTRATRSDSFMPKIDVRGSQKKHSWRVLPEQDYGTVFVFESPIEAMSYMSLLKEQGQSWTRSAFLSLGGVGGAALENYLAGAPATKKVYLCLNNDAAGREGTARLLGFVGARGRILLPAGEGNDWNDALRAYRTGHAVRADTSLASPSRSTAQAHKERLKIQNSVGQSAERSDGR